MRSRIGKCTNYSGCKLAYRNERISVVTKSFVCPECGSALEQIARAPRSSGVWILGFAVVLVTLIALAVLLWIRLTATERPNYEPTELIIPTPTPRPLPTPTPPPAPLASTPVPTPEPTTAFELNQEDLAKIKDEVLQRINLMPEITERQRTMLIASLTKARGMTLIARISFATAQKELTETDLATIRATLDSPAIVGALENPTLVFVILGYASKQGNPQTNLQLSQLRADTVMNTLQQQFKIQNVIYPVPMGPSTLFSTKSFSDNQVAEIWAVLP